MRVADVCVCCVVLGALQTYTAPVVQAEDPAGIEAQLAALKAPLPADHSDFALVRRIAAFVIEDMKARLGSHFMPHHTQMLTVQMFLQSAALHGGNPGNVISQVWWAPGEGQAPDRCRAGSLTVG